MVIASKTINNDVRVISEKYSLDHMKGKLARICIT